MSLTAEQAAALEAEVTTETETPDAPASGEQPTEERTEPTEEATETPAEGEPTNEAEGDKPADEKKADEEKAKADAAEKAKAWQQVEAAKKAQVQVARARQKLEQDVERVRSYESQLESREKSLDAREARVSQLEQALQSGNLDALIDLGFDYEAATRRQLENLDPNARVARLERELRERDEKSKKEREEQEKLSRAQQAVEQTRREALALVKLVDDEPEDFPDLFLWAPERIAEEGIAFRDAYVRQHRQMPTFEIVLNALQKTAKAEATAAEQRRTGLQQRRSPTSSDAGSARKVDTRPNSGEATTPALSPTAAAQRVTPPREKTEAEIDDECRQMLRGLKR